MKCRHSKHSSQFTRSFKKVTRLYVVCEWIWVFVYWFFIKTIKEAHGQTGWLETCARTVGQDSAGRGESKLYPNKFRLLNPILGYGSLIRTYVQFILAKLRFHRIRPEFNGLFEYEEYVTLKGIDDPNEGCVNIIIGVLSFWPSSLVMRPYPTWWVCKNRSTLSNGWYSRISRCLPTTNVEFLRLFPLLKRVGAYTALLQAC